jgi:hypothetical protein
MKSLQGYLQAGRVLLGVLLLTGQTNAADFGVGATATPDPVVQGNTLTYTLTLTNLTGSSVPDVAITNSFSGTVTYNSSSTTLPGTTVLTDATTVIFQISTFLNTDPIGSVTFNVTPAAAGPLTNSILVTAPGRTNVTTNVVTQVIYPTGDLAVGLTNQASGVLTNETTVIGLFATNLGPSAISSVTVSHTLPSSFTLLSVSGTNYTYGGTNLIWNVGPLASGVATQLLVTVRPTNAGTYSLTAAISGNVNDTNAANDAVTNSLEVTTFLPSDLEFLVVTQRISRQTGLLEMFGVLTNKADTNVPAARVTVSGLTGYNWLYNATGTNSGIPYVNYNNTISNRSGVNLTLEFYAIPRGWLTNLQFAAFAMELLDVVTPTNTTVAAAGAMTPWGFMVEFPVTVGRTYTIVYSDDPSFSNPRVAQPSILATANRIQWIDSGPPKTISLPPTPGGRYYRVFQSQ